MESEARAHHSHTGTCRMTIRAGVLQAKVTVGGADMPRERDIPLGFAAEQMKIGMEKIGVRLVTVCVIGMATLIVTWLLGSSAHLSPGLTFGLVAGAVAATFAAFVVTVRRSVLTPIEEVCSGLDRLARGDFSTPIDAHGVREICGIAQSAERIRKRLGTVISEVSGSTQELSEKLGDLNGRAANAAAKSRTQSADALSMATVVEMMTYGIDSMAAQAQQLQTLAATAGELSIRGADVIQKAVSEIGQIADSVDASSTALRNLEKQSDEIGSIVQVISDIASQTNLLALNAAIEAARAGEQGRGFAVVADEVRKLAERTTSSTQEIAKVIQRIQADTAGAAGSLDSVVSQVAEGTSLAQQASVAITEIRTGVVDVAQAVNEISEALKQQSATNSDYSQKVVGIAQTSEENSVIIEQIAATSRALDGVATKLQAAAIENMG